jgi:hypothetical protein
VGALTAHRQVAAVAQATVAAEVHQALDVHLHFAAQVAFDGEVGVDMLADLPALRRRDSSLTRRVWSMPTASQMAWRRCGRCR